MEEDREKQVDVVDTPEEQVDNDARQEDQRQAERVRAANTQRTSAADDMEPLFEAEEAKKFRSRWLAIQNKFVDDPRDSVKQADDLVADVIKNMTMNFSNRRVGLEKQWNSGENISTEDLRVAIQRYRSFFDRLLTLES